MSVGEFRGAEVGNLNRAGRSQVAEMEGDVGVPGFC